MAYNHPQLVESVKPTIGELRHVEYFVKASRMSEEAEFSDIAQRLRRLREAFSEDSQKVWAERHGFNATQYNNWETGLRRNPVPCAIKLSDTYGLSLDFLYRGRREGLSESARKVL